MERELYDFFYEAEDRHWWFVARRRILMAVLERSLPRTGIEITDMGCGTGGMAAPLGRFGRVAAVDEAPAAREYCRRRGVDRVLSLAEWDAEATAYDLVTAFDVVEHVEDDLALLKRLHARLKPGGMLVVTVPAYRFLWSPFDEMNHHYRRYSRGELRGRLEGAGFRVRRASYFNTLLFPVIAIVRLAERGLGLDATDEAAKRKALARWFKVGPLNGLLSRVFALERHWLVGHDLPTGCSVLAVAVKD